MLVCLIVLFLVVILGLVCVVFDFDLSVDCFCLADRLLVNFDSGVVVVCLVDCVVLFELLFWGLVDWHVIVCLSGVWFVK